MITLEASPQTLEAEIFRLEELVALGACLEPRTGAFYLGALQALRWANGGWVAPSSIPPVVAEARL